MNNFHPIHQFEIRYSNILNFTSTIRDTIAPFVRLADKISIDFENTVNERISLVFNNEKYHVSIMWDRILFKSIDMDVFQFSENNSLIEEPFFNIFKKVTEMSGFGDVRNFLFFFNNIKKNRCQF